MNNKQAFANIFAGLLQIISNSKATSQIKPTIPKSPAKRDVESEDSHGTSYFSYLNQQFKKYKVVLPKFSQQQQRPSYRLSEDVYLLLQLSSHTTVSIKVFQEIHKKGHINRSVESMRSRFSQYLRWLETNAFKKIIEHIKKVDGFQGFLVFEDGSGHKVFSSVSMSDVPRQKKAQKRQRPQSLQKQETIQSQEARSLRRQIVNYANIIHAPTTFLLQKLDQLSGDLNDLQKFIQTRNEQMLWTAQEDCSLKEGDTRALIRYKGEQQVTKRKEYLGIS